MRILFLSRWYPFPATNGSKIRVFNLLAHLGRSHDVDLLSFHAPEEPVGEADLEAMRAHCRDVRAVPYRPFAPGSLRALAGLFGAMPRSLVDSYSHEFAGVVAATAAATPYDVVIASQIDMPIYAHDLQGPATVLEEVEISIFREQLHRAEGLAARVRKGLMWSKWRRFVRQVMDDVDLVTVVSQREAEPLLAITPGYARLAVVPNGADLTRLTGHFADPVPDTLVYTGALSYYVNFDAMAFWLRDVWPRVLARRPSARLQMAGRTEGTGVAELPVDDSATHVGHQADVRPLVQGAWASVVPERVGGGTRIKLFESLALGTPVIATRWAANGVEARDGEEILVADTAQELADATVRLLGDAALRQRLSRQGRALVERKYDWRVIGAAFEARLEEAVRHRRDRR
jgi:glycosyltransferase involved in cell wall biosynthesis